MQITAISVFLTLLLSPSSSIFNYLLGISRHLLWSVPYTANFLSPTLACSFSFISLLGCRHRHPSTQMPAAEILKSALTLLSGQLCTTSALVFSLRLVLTPHAHCPCHCQNSGSHVDGQSSLLTGFPASRFSMLL